jgi:ribosomal protein S27AE
METRVIHEIYLKRKTCENCGDTKFEFGDIPEKKYICSDCGIGLMPINSMF